MSMFETVIGFASIIVLGAATTPVKIDDAQPYAISVVDEKSCRVTKAPNGYAFYIEHIMKDYGVGMKLSSGAFLGLELTDTQITSSKESRTPRVTVTFTGHSAEPDYRWITTGRYPTMLLNLSFEMKNADDFEALHYFQKARHMTVDYSGKVKQFDLSGSMAMSHLFRACLQKNIERDKRESDLFFEKLRKPNQP